MYDIDDDDDDDGKGKKKKKRTRLWLNDKMINKLQNYYGIAVRACSGKSMEEMKRDVGASLYHVISCYHCCGVDNEEQRHMFCPKTPLS